MKKKLTANYLADTYSISSLEESNYYGWKFWITVNQKCALQTQNPD